MPTEFIQVGDTAIARRNITGVVFLAGGDVNISSVGDDADRPPWVFSGSAAKAFRKWWDKQESVLVLWPPKGG